MRCHLFLAIPLAGLSAAIPNGPARADEAYVCDGGRIVTVKPGELDALKHTDACIAGYYGLTVPAAPAATTPETSPLPSKAAAAPKISPERAAQGLAIERAALTGAKNSVITTGAIAPAAQAAREPVASSSDFRNVRLLNPKPGASTVFRHDR